MQGRLLQTKVMPVCEAGVSSLVVQPLAGVHRCRCRRKPYILTGEFAHDSLVDWIREKLVAVRGVCVFTLIALRFSMNPKPRLSMAH